MPACKREREAALVGPKGAKYAGHERLALVVASQGRVGASFEMQADALETWVREKEGALSRQSNNDLGENRLARWINRQQLMFAEHGTLQARIGCDFLRAPA